MFVFISGGARSGKSSWAEEYALSLCPAKSPVYLATARVRDEEMRARVLRHREIREGRGFKTLEQDTNVSAAIAHLPPRATVLLECLSTLLANEMFGESSHEKKCGDKIYEEILLLKARSENLLIVSNDIFSDGVTCGQETEDYRRTLGALHIKLARDADIAIECVCGLALPHKRKSGIQSSAEK